jgi:putative flippase GtrA
MNSCISNRSVGEHAAEWSVFAACLQTMSPLFAACAGFLLATFVNFFLSRTFVFKSRLGYVNEFAAVGLASGGVFLLNLTVFYGLYALLAVPVMIAKVMGTLVGFVGNYAVRQFWIFSGLPRHAPVLELLRPRKKPGNRK